jgi:segregation and condensation protein A
MSQTGTLPPENAEDFRCRINVFEGPLDLLLYLIKKNEIDLNQVRLEEITSQYMEYLNLMESMNVDLASEFIVTAATLLYLKTRWLLPTEPGEDDEDDEDDPHGNLIRRLLEYKKFKEAAGYLEQKHDDENRTFRRGTRVPLDLPPVEEKFSNADVFDLCTALAELLRKKKWKTDEVHGEEFTVEQKIREFRDRLSRHALIRFSRVVHESRSKSEVICIFLAMLELIRLQEITVEQKGRVFGEILIRRRRSSALSQTGDV